MHRHPPRTTNSKGSNFPGADFIFCIQPDARQSYDTAARDLVFFKRPDDGFFKETEILVYVSKKILEVQDRVTNQLPRTMIRDVASPVDVKIISLVFFQPFFIEQQMIFLAGFSK